MPLLLAEGDRDAYRRQQAALAREREIMKDVKDWEVSLFYCLVRQVVQEQAVTDGTCLGLVRVCTG